jgi:hypothetical protein
MMKPEMTKKMSTPLLPKGVSPTSLRMWLMTTSAAAMKRSACSE